MSLEEFITSIPVISSLCAYKLSVARSVLLFFDPGTFRTTPSKLEINNVSAPFNCLILFG